MNDKDTIYRQAAIDALDKRFDGVPMELTTEILELRRDPWKGEDEDENR